MRRLLPFILSLAVACGSDSSTQPNATPASLAGTWNLQTINGAALPFTLLQTPKTELLSDVVTAVAAGTYTELSQVRTTLNGQVTVSTESDGGTYTITGNTVTIRSTDGSTALGTVNGNLFTIAAGGISFEYKKQ